MIHQLLLLVPQFCVTHHSKIIKRSKFNCTEIKVTERHTKEATPSDMEAFYLLGYHDV